MAAAAAAGTWAALGLRADASLGASSLPGRLWAVSAAVSEQAGGAAKRRKAAAGRDDEVRSPVIDKDGSLSISTRCSSWPGVGQARISTCWLVFQAASNGRVCLVTAGLSVIMSLLFMECQVWCMRVFRVRQPRLRGGFALDTPRSSFALDTRSRETRPCWVQDPGQTPDMVLYSAAGQARLPLSRCQLVTLAHSSVSAPRRLRAPATHSRRPCRRRPRPG